MRLPYPENMQQRSDMKSEKRITILGLGNILLQDEGFGVHFVNWFSRRYVLPESVCIIDGGTLGYGLLETVSACDVLIIVDVIKADDTPGSLYRFSRREMEQKRPAATSAHEVEFFDVLLKAELMGQCPEAVFLCVVPGCIDEMKMEMTGLLRGRFPDMERLLLHELAGLNVFPEGTCSA